ncbi:MAG: site-specific integrase [Bryobacteraceae bacterium]|nr:site-specific integrase [Bryobacteraceae bacterium]
MAVYRPTYRDATTGERKQSDTWWYDFNYVGRRIRESAKTTRKTIAVEAEKKRRRELERAYAGIPSEKPEERIRTISELLASYRKGYAVNHRDKAALRVKSGSAHVDRILGALLLPDLTQERIIGYMADRQTEGASNRTINIELGVLSRAIGLPWRALWPKVRKLEENSDVGRALEPEEERLLLEAAAGNKRSPLIYPFLVTLAWTGMRSDEARLLQWLQVDFEAGEVRVGKSKTEAGAKRVIPMSSVLRAALEHHAGWYAGKLGLIRPEHYVFPFMDRTRPVDAKRPVTSLKKAWHSARTAAGVDCRLHDLRHSFCTKLGEAGVPERTMLDIMGHVSAAMLKRYSHIRAKARREAIEAVESRQFSIGVPKVSPKVGDSAADLTDTKLLN